MHVFGANQLCGQAYLGRARAQQVRLWDVPPPGTLRKDMCTDTQMHTFSGHSRISILKMKGHTVHVVRKYFL